MRVFSVEMLVKEEGAAVVEAALKRLKKETQDVATQMKATSQSVVSTGNAMKTAGSAAEISGGRAAKAAIGFAAVGQSLARTGSLTADAGTRIIEAGSHIASMFGPGGLAVAALLGFATAAMTSFGKASAEAKKMEEEFNKSINNIVNQGDIVALTKQLRDLELGVPSGALDEIVTVSDGIVAMRARIKELQDSGFTTFNKANRTELNALTTALRTAEAQALSLRNAILNASRPRGEPTAAPITITGAAPSTAGRTARSAAKTEFDLYQTASESALKAFEDQQAAIAKRPPFQVLPADFIDTVKAELDQTASEISRAGVDAMLPIGAVIGSSLSQGLAQSIENGIVSGLEMGIASGNIGEAFRAMGQAIVQSMARAMVGIAVAAIKLGTLMEKIRLFMIKHPALAVVSAVALLALARSLGGGASGTGMSAIGGEGGLTYGAAGGGGMSSTLPTQQIIFGSTSATTAAGMTPRQAMNVTIIGPNDPSAQRAIQELITRADTRGRVG